MKLGQLGFVLAAPWWRSLNRCLHILLVSWEQNCCHSHSISQQISTVGSRGQHEQGGFLPPTNFTSRRKQVADRIERCSLSAFSYQGGKMPELLPKCSLFISLARTDHMFTLGSGPRPTSPEIMGSDTWTKLIFWWQGKKGGNKHCLPWYSYYFLLFTDEKTVA